MNKNYKILLVKQGMFQVKHEMEQEYKDHNLLCSKIEGWSFQNVHLYYLIYFLKDSLTF